MQITIDIPDDISTTVKDNLPQILALGLREINANPNNGFSGLTEILHFLAKLPSPQEVLNLRLAPEAQQEIDNLLEKIVLKVLTKAIAYYGNIMNLSNI